MIIETLEGALGGGGEVLNRRILFDAAAALVSKNLFFVSFFRVKRKSCHSQLHFYPQKRSSAT